MQHRITAQEVAAERESTNQRKLLNIRSAHAAVVHGLQAQVQGKVDEMRDAKSQSAQQIQDLRNKLHRATQQLQDFQEQLQKVENNHAAEFARLNIIYESGRRLLASQLNNANKMVQDSGARLEGYLLRQPIQLRQPVKGRPPSCPPEECGSIAHIHT